MSVELICFGITCTNSMELRRLMLQAPGVQIAEIISTCEKTCLWQRCEFADVSEGMLRRGESFRQSSQVTVQLSSCADDLHSSADSAVLEGSGAKVGIL